MLILLVQQRQAQLRLEIARNQHQEVLIVKTRKIITLHLLVHESTVKEPGYVGIVQKQHLIQIVLGISPLLQLDVPCRLLQSQINAVGMIRQLIRGSRQRITQRLVLRLRITHSFMLRIGNRHIILLRHHGQRQQKATI